MIIFTICQIRIKFTQPVYLWIFIVSQLDQYNNSSLHVFNQ